MTSLNTLRNTSRPKKKVQRVGRGIGSHRGKTSGRGQKGDGSRSGYKRRFGYEGGQVPLYRKLPVRGFTRGRFAKPKTAITLAQIEAHFEEGDQVNPETLLRRGLVTRKESHQIAVLANGELSKKVSIQAHRFSKTAEEKLKAQGIFFEVLA